MRYQAILAALLLVFAAACGTSSQFGHSSTRESGPASNLTRTEQVADSAQLAPAAPYHETLEEAQWWSLLESAPGTPGVSYDPLSLMVAFDPQGSLPSAWSAATPAELAAVQARTDAWMTQEAPQFVEHAAALAAHFGLQVESQFYRDGMRTAFFRAPAGTDMTALMDQLRTAGGSLVKRVAFEPLRHAAFTPNDPDYTSSTASNWGPQWGHHRVKVGTAWDYTLGDPDVWVVVADTGVLLTHEELAGQVLDPAVEFANFNLDVRNNDDTVNDTDGHGTFIAGIVGAMGSNGRTITGVAPGCKVVPVKIANGGTTGAQYIINGCYKGKELKEAFPDKQVVVNLSWGGDQAIPQEAAMVTALLNTSVLLVVAAGNDGLNTPNSYPSMYTNCISVGSTGWTGGPDVRSDFSNYGDYVDIAAPGIELKSCRETGNSAYVPQSQGSGTSYSAPIVAAGAALMLSYDPTLTIAQLRTALEDTGDPTTGFSATNPVLRLNLENAFETISGVRVSAPKLDKLVYSGSIALTPTVKGGPTSVECRLNGNLEDVKTAAPYDFNLDISSINFGKASVEFKAINGADVATSTVDFIVDNSLATFPLAEFFNPADPRVFEAIDVKAYAPSFLSAIKAEPAPNWTADTVASAGGGVWNYPVAGGAAGQGAYMGIAGQNNYANGEIDVLVSRRVNLSGIVNPSLVFQHKFNIQDGGSDLDKARVLVTENDGLTWSPALFGGTANPAVWSGSSSNYILAEVDLSDFANKTVHVALVFEADSSGVGEVAGNSGWWVDSLVLSRNYSTAIPTIESVVTTKQSVAEPLPAVSSASVVGAALDIKSFDVNITGPNQVTRVLYWLDLANAGGNFGTLDLADPTANVTGPNFLTNLKVPGKRNQLAILRVQYFDAANNPGPIVEKEVYLFDLRGDTDANGIVNQLDLDNYAGKLGLSAGQPGYSVFLDSDLDGTLTEADAAGVGYNWGLSS